MATQEEYEKAQRELAGYYDEQGAQNAARKAGREVMGPAEGAQYQHAIGSIDPFSPMHYGGGNGELQKAVGYAQQRQAEAQYRPDILANPTGVNVSRASELAARNAQAQANQYYAAMAQGQGPSVADPMYQAALQRGVQGAAGVLSNQRGGGGAGSEAMRAAMNGSMQQLGGLGQQYADQRLGEQFQGIGGYSAGANAMNQGDLSRAGLSAKWAADQANSRIAQRGQNMQDRQYWSGLENQMWQNEQGGVADAWLAQVKDAQQAQARATAENQRNLQAGLGYVGTGAQLFGGAMTGGVK